MTISLDNIGKRFNYEWIFRHIDYQFTEGKAYALTGPNGSGKTTLLQIISGSLTFSEGYLNYLNPGLLPPESLFRQCSLAAPYLELIEELTLEEAIGFHRKFKPLIPGLRSGDLIERMGLARARHKQIRYFSSGMKQRIKLALAIFSDVPVILLDEPCTNLDAEGIHLYHQLFQQYCRQRMVIVSSNDPQEYDFCSHIIQILDFRPDAS